jgi:hypothetical protein
MGRLPQRGGDPSRSRLPRTVSWLLRRTFFRIRAGTWDFWRFSRDSSTRSFCQHQFRSKRGRLLQSVLHKRLSIVCIYGGARRLTFVNGRSAAPLLGALHPSALRVRRPFRLSRHYDMNHSTPSAVRRSSKRSRRGFQTGSQTIEDAEQVAIIPSRQSLPLRSRGDVSRAPPLRSP